MQLTESQTGALQAILKDVSAGKPLISLSGAAGTGKTTLIKALLEHLPEAVVCTPTNKAAQVLNSKGIEASTFYKKFYILEDETEGRPRFISCKRWQQEGGRGLPEGKTSYEPVLIIDEASMVTSRSLSEMQRMCDTLILVGDHNQLPPVGDRDYPEGRFGSLDHTAELTEIMRQAEGSLILELADELRRDGPRVNHLVRCFEPEDSFQSWVKEGAQMIAFTNKERQRINHVARRILGFDKPYPQMGDKLLITNNFSDVLVNGTVVDVVGFSWNGVSEIAELEIVLPTGSISTQLLSMAPFIKDQIAGQRTLLEEKFDPKDNDELMLEATFAYCLTAHKAQGSEWDTVIVFDQRGLVRKVAESDERGALSPEEMVRRWTYTAITRARKNLIVAPTWYAQVSDRGI